MTAITAPTGLRAPARTLLLTLVLAILLPPMAARAHWADSYYDSQWVVAGNTVTGPTVLAWGFSPSFDEGARADTIAAAEAWNVHAEGLRFEHVGDVASDPGPGSCPLDPLGDVQVLRRGAIDGPSGEDGGGILAITALCSMPLTGHAFHFTITYDEDEPFFMGDGQLASNEFDLQGILVHEFGHATGWGRHFEDDTGTECLWGKPRHTMCSTVAPGTLDPRTLEEHDIHTFRDAY